MNGDNVESSVSDPPDYEYVIIGAGVCGLYLLHRLRELGGRVLALDSNGDVGGTWYHNRYPGCRFDSESFTYGYSWSPEVLAEWNWTERFASQPETLRYLRFVADRFGLRSDISFDTTVRTAEWDEATTRWVVHTTDGRRISTRVLLTAMGLLSVPTSPRIPGLDSFEGIARHTFEWTPDIDVTGKRVAVIGTGSTGVQVITTIADTVASLTVLQRDPNWCVPLHNSAISVPEMEEIRRHYDEIFASCHRSPSGFTHRPLRTKSVEVTRQERLALWEKLYQEPGFGLWLGNFRDTMLDEQANRELSEFVATKIRERVHDPVTAELLVPKDHGFGTKRVPLESGYYEVYNRAGVELVDLNDTPIECVVPNGIQLRTKDGIREVGLDVIVFATGFDAVTGAFDQIDFRGVDGVRLRDRWDEGPQTYLGVGTTDFPNLVMVGGPQSGSVAANFPRGIEDMVNWTTSFIRYLRDNDIARFEARREAELSWVSHVREFNDTVLMSRTKSWFNGHNANLDRPERSRPLIYTGGAVRYRRALTDEASGGYPGFGLAGVPGDATGRPTAGAQ